MEDNAATSGGQPAASERSARLGLALVLVGAAVSAAILIAGVLPSLTSGSAVDTNQVDRVASSVATSIDAALETASSVAQDLRGDATLRPLLGKVAPPPAPSPLPAITDAAARLAGGDPEIAVLTAAGAPRYALAGGAPTLPSSAPVGIPAFGVIAKAPGGLFITPVTADGDGIRRISIAAVITPAGSAKGGIVVVTLSIDALLRAALASDGTPGATLELVDESGTQLAAGKTVPAGSSAGARGTSIVATATRPVGLPSGFPTWMVVARLPIPTTAPAPFPLPALVAAVLVLAVACLLGVAISLRHTRRVSVSRRELAERYEEVATQAFVDVITGLGNQRAFHDECERQLELVRRGHMSMSLVMLDLDDFKRANDSDGHAAGDELLARFARHVEGCIRRSDRAFRVGGDEFAIIMPATDTDGAEVVARRLLAMALEPAAGKLSAMRTISFSAGISEGPKFGTTRAELFAQADAALYWSKRHGRTQVTVFDPARMAVAGRVSDELSASVATVVEERQLRAVFQPVVDLGTGRILGYEGLVRPTTAGLPEPRCAVHRRGKHRADGRSRLCLPGDRGGCRRKHPVGLLRGAQSLAAHHRGARVQRPRPVPPAGPARSSGAADRPRAHGARDDRGRRSTPPGPRGLPRAGCPDRGG